MEPLDLFKAAFALALVLALIGLATVVAKRYGIGLPTSGRRRGKHKRLDMVDMMALDAKRRLVLVRRDDVEHLLILGPQSETVVETGIQAPESFSQALEDAADPAHQDPETPS